MNNLGVACYAHSQCETNCCDSDSGSYFVCQNFSLCAKQPNNDKIIATIVIGSVVTIGIICYAAYKCFKKKPKYEYIERAVDTMI